MLTNEYPYFEFPFVKFNVAQASVIPMITDDNNLVICFNTAVGKSALGESAFGYHLATEEESKVVYVVPYKSLGNEKYEEWSLNKNFSKYNIVLNTSDSPASEEDLKKARIIITTSESLDSKARSQSNVTWIKKIKCLVVDEAHLVGTEGRGSAIESSLMRLTTINPSMRIILLSATMTNSLSIAKWIKSLNGKQTKKVESDWRPNEIKMRIFPFDDSNNTETNKMNNILDVLNKDYSFGKKTIIFVHSKLFGEKLKTKIVKSGLKCAFHNASLDAKSRSKIEKEFDDPTSGFDILVSTSTLSAGVNIG